MSAISQTQDCFLVRAGETTGPFSFEEVKAMAADGRLEDDSYWWREGMPGWVPVAKLKPAESREETDRKVASPATKKSVGLGLAFAVGAACLAILTAAAAWTFLDTGNKPDNRLASLHRINLDLRPEN